MSWTKKLTAWLLVLLFFLVALKVFDLVVGLMTKSKSQTSVTRSILLKEYQPFRDETIIPSREYISETQGLEQKPFRLRTDKDGFIVGSNDFLESAKTKAVDVIFFGGSTTECIYVDEDYRFPYLVSQKVKTAEGKAIRVLNGGVSGNHSLHSLLNYLAKGLPYRPKYVVLMHAINDLSLLSKTLSYWEAPASRKIVQQSNDENRAFASEPLRRLKDLFVPNLWAQLRPLFVTKGDVGAAEDEWRAYRDKKSNYSEIEIALKKEFRASITSFVLVSRAWGVEPVLMTQFNRINAQDLFVRSLHEKVKQPISYDDFVKLYEVANDIVRQVATENDVMLIDLDRRLAGASGLIYDGVHLNTNGSKFVAEIVSDALAKNMQNNSGWISQ